LQKARFNKLNKNSARAPKEFRLSFFASQNKQVQKKHRNSEEPPFAIRGAGDTLPHVEECFKKESDTRSYGKFSKLARGRKPNVSDEKIHNWHTGSE
jgi:hypothetical protein